MPSARLGFVQYLNTLPLVEGLGTWREVELVPAVPAKLSGLLRAGSIDVGLCSLVDAAATDPAAEPLTLVPAGMIGCDGPTLTVRLFSAVPLERVTVLHADTESHTSVVLAQILLRQRFGARPTVRDFDATAHTAHTAPGTPATPHWPETLLIIGDKVVTDPPPADRYPHQLDLGEAWHAWTGLPFVYGMWMCRSVDAASTRVAVIAEMLERQRLRNTLRLDWLVDRYASTRGWPADLARRYVGEYLRYAVGPRERAAVTRFFAEAASLGTLPATQPRWLN